MKKLVVGVLLLALAAAVFADDALVLPKGVLRTYFTGAYAFFDQEWDSTGEKVDVAGFDSLSLINVGGAVEFGVIDWISAAVQWAPGWNVWSTTENGTPPYDRLLANGSFDIFAGAKIQVIGPKAPVASEKIRLAAAPGVKIPLPPPDWEQERANQTSGTENFIAESLDKHVLGLGLRAYFDYVLSKMFYLNLYSEFIYYPVADKRENVSLTDWTLVNVALQSNYDVEFGYDLTLEAEPHFEMMFGNGMRLGVGVPITYTMSPEIVRDGTAVADTDSYLLSVSPNVSLFLTKFFIPTEIKVGYTLPLVGKNANATNTVVVQLKTYLRFYK